MFNIHESWHKSVILHELMEFVPDGSFARRLYKQIGIELDGQLDRAWEEDNNSLAEALPVEELFHLLVGGWRFDVQWLMNDDGTYLDDDGNLLPPTVKIACTPSEQLAVYGLWLLESAIDSLGDIPERV